MIYNDFGSLKLSALGLGTMRFPKCGNGDGDIDYEKTAEMIDYAIKNGVNYFDTAWGYHAGQSEIVTGKILSAYDRSSFYLASKFPGYELDNIKNKQAVFEKQLQKCGVDYFDFYLLHTVAEYNIDNYLNKEYGLLDYLLEQKKNGRIRHLGFSVHAEYDCFKRFLDECGEHMEFCQIQLNYLDHSFQQAGKKVQLLNERNIPIWVMEPVRGGRLANLSEEDTATLKKLRTDETVPGWAFRYLQSIPGVTVTLSGMSDMKQLKENIDTYSTAKPLSEREMDALYSIAHRMTNEVPCTSCRYCIEKCVQELEIPKIISQYNKNIFENRKFSLSSEDALSPSRCVSCKACETVCPQGIKISEIMSSFRKRAEEAEK